MQFETFAPLEQLAFITHAFTLRADDDTKADDFEEKALRSIGLPPHHCATAQQTHGKGVAVVTGPRSRIPGVDALATREPNLPLLIRCADCATVFIVDRTTPAVALVHSGKAGTLSNVVGHTVRAMEAQLGTRPHDCLAFISPSIGPCHYEMNIWSDIGQQLREAGVADIQNPRICTACHLDRYFSYRAEHGKTGRMLAVLSLKPQ
jgi:purine-nucleoside/S-methyl-5'-thioadenosine phosphorylase / adenosine deaminase